MRTCLVVGRAVFVLMIVTGMSLHASAQSRSRSFQPSQSGSQTRPGSVANANVAIEGYCPVCIVDMKQWVRGTPQHQANYDGRTYYFPNNEIKNTFLANPGKYVPALGGDCTVCLAKMGKRMPGDVFHAAFHQGRLYLFPGADQKQMFVDNPGEFANVDLALGGLCAVCQVEMKKDVPGKPEFAAYRNGMRYLFPSAEQLRMFEANPQKYVATQGSASIPAATGPQSDTSFEQPSTALDQQTISVTGTSTCAGCDHGVSPIGDPDELGLGIETEDGKLYVIEQAHTLYPKVYKDRFQKLKLTVNGRVLKKEGDVVWVTPTELQVVD